MRSVYGIEVLDTNDKYIEIAEEAALSLTSMAPGKYLVDSIPLRKLFVGSSQIKNKAMMFSMK